MQCRAKPCQSEAIKILLKLFLFAIFSSLLINVYLWAGCGAAVAAGAAGLRLGFEGCLAGIPVGRSRAEFCKPGGAPVPRGLKAGKCREVNRRHFCGKVSSVSCARLASSDTSVTEMGISTAP